MLGTSHDGPSGALAATADGRFLYATSPGGGTLTVLRTRIGGGGGGGGRARLTAVQKVPVATSYHMSLALAG